jgi:glutaredoxin
MNPESAPPTSAWRQTLIALALAGLALPAAALYKVVGPDGRITYTDRPPSDTAARVTTLNRDGVNEAPAPQDTLPQDLRQATTRFPVTLYSAADCPPCDSARQLLVQRGVPFTEKLIVSDDDATAMERVLGARTVPSLTIGTQALRGLSQSDWTAYLDAAGYPRDSKLPKNWQAPAATPLVVRKSGRSASAPLATASAPARSAPAAAAPVLPPAPAGIRF